MPRAGEPIAPRHETSTTRCAAAGAAERANKAAGLPDFSGLVAAYGPAVVNISVIFDTRVDDDVEARHEDLLERFLQRYGVPFETQTPTRGMGSGFIVTTDGYVLTNAHVVDNAASVTVKLVDRREFPARVVGSDDASDIAVLKIDARGLPAVKFGHPLRLVPGQWVAAIGSPFGFDNSVTVGVVSATSRSLPFGSDTPYIQTDVAVNPGNSGGPLFNLSGEVVGVNSNIASRNGGYMGVSFAIPIDEAMEIEAQLIRSGRVVRGHAGIRIQEVDAPLAQAFGLDHPGGALITVIESHGAAETAGLRTGDIVLAVDGAPIEFAPELSGRLARMKPGARTTFLVWHEGRRREVQVTLGKETEFPERPAPAHGDASSLGMGLAVRALSVAERAELRLEAGLLVLRATGASAGAGIEPGDILLAINATPVASTDELQKALEKSAPTAALLIERGGERMFVAVPRAGR